MNFHFITVLLLLLFFFFCTVCLYVAIIGCYRFTTYLITSSHCVLKSNTPKVNHKVHLRPIFVRFTTASLEFSEICVIFSELRLLFGLLIFDIISRCLLVNIKVFVFFFAQRCRFCTSFKNSVYICMYLTTYTYIYVCLLLFFYFFCLVYLFKFLFSFRFFYT